MSGRFVKFWTYERDHTRTWAMRTTSRYPVAFSLFVHRHGPGIETGVRWVFQPSLTIDLPRPTPTPKETT